MSEQAPERFADRPDPRPEDLLVRVHPNVLGAIAVVANENLVHNEMTGDSPMLRGWLAEIHDKDAKSFEEKRQLELNQARNNLLELDREHGRYIDNYLNAQAPDFFKDLKAEADVWAGETLKWATFLTGKSTPDKVTGKTPPVPEGASMNDAQLTNFLEWHTDKVADMQPDAETTELINNRKEEFKTLIESQVASGDLPYEVLPRLALVDVVDVYATDPLHLLAPTSGAINFMGRRSISVAPTAIGKSSQTALRFNITQYLWHELNHEAVQTATQVVPIGKRWVMEAITEEKHQDTVKVHAEKARLGHPESVMAPEVSDAIADLFAVTVGRRIGNRMPSSSSRTGSYLEERDLLKDFVGDHYREAVFAYAGTFGDEQHFYGLMDQRWGAKDALVLLNTHIEKLEREIAKKDRTLTTRSVEIAALAQARQDLRDDRNPIFAQSTTEDKVLGLSGSGLIGIAGGGSTKGAFDRQRGDVRRKSQGVYGRMKPLGGSSSFLGRNRKLPDFGRGHRQPLTEEDGPKN